MKRTYNVFVDNGLFVLAYYLEKDIEDITEKDIENNIQLISDKIVKFTKCEKYSNLKSMVFPNSPLTQKGGNLAEKVKTMFSNKGTDICCRCGEHKANIFNDINKTYIPNIVSLTMYNFSNNLQGVNICPNCLALTIFSMLNCRVVQEVVLYNHTDDEFMYDYTSEMQEQNNNDIYSNAGKNKSGETKTDLISKMWSLKDHTCYKGYLEQVRFNNIGLGMPTFEVRNLDDKDIELVGKLKVQGLWTEFVKPEYYLLANMLEGRLVDSYARNIIKFDENNGVYDIKCSRKLLEFLNKEVSRLSSEIIEVIDRVCDGIVELNKTQESYKNLKYLSDGIGPFERFLIDILSSYLELTGNKLFDFEQMEKLINRMRYRRVKNLMIVKLVERL